MLGGMIQTDANINGGNSGGPMINAVGRQIGIIESKRTGVEGLGFAIQVDRFREILPKMLSAEVRYGYRLGLQVAPMPTATVTSVEAGSPAATAGVRVGDVVTRVGDVTVTDGVHFYLALVDVKAGQSVPIVLQRNGESVNLTVTPAAFPPRPAETVNGLIGGMYLRAYLGQWRSLPDFETLQPISWGVVPRFGLYVQGKARDHFGLKFTGFVEVPADGLYAFSTKSDDGTRLWIGDRLVVDNDEVHGVREATGLVRLSKGKHPIMVAFFEHSGEEHLEVFYEGPGLDKQPIPPSALFCQPEASAPPSPVVKPVE